MSTWRERSAFILLVAVLFSLKSCPERIEERMLHRRILPRSAWRPSLEVDRRRLGPLGRPFRITVHHSATTPRQGSWAATCAAIRGIQKFHMVQRGWADIGYHFVIDRVGRIWEGRPASFQGAHAGNAQLNRGNLGILVLGNFERREPTAAEEAALFWLLEQLTGYYGIGADHILCHRDLKATRCPGKHLEPLVRRLAAAIDQGVRSIK
jgi:hypothetical protein